MAHVRPKEDELTVNVKKPQFKKNQKITKSTLANDLKIVIDSVEAFGVTFV